MSYFLNLTRKHSRRMRTARFCNSGRKGIRVYPAPLHILPLGILYPVDTLPPTYPTPWIPYPLITTPPGYPTPIYPSPYIPYPQIPYSLDTLPLIPYPPPHKPPTPHTPPLCIPYLLDTLTPSRRHMGLEIPTPPREQTDACENITSRN